MMLARLGPQRPEQTWQRGQRDGGGQGAQGLRSRRAADLRQRGHQVGRRLADAGHQAHGLFEQVHDVVSGFCARTFDAEGDVKEHVGLLEGYDDDPSIKTLVDDGYQVLTL